MHLSHNDLTAVKIVSMLWLFLVGVLVVLAVIFLGPHGA